MLGDPFGRLTVQALQLVEGIDVQLPAGDPRWDLRLERTGRALRLTRAVGAAVLVATTVRASVVTASVGASVVPASVLGAIVTASVLTTVIPTVEATLVAAIAPWTVIEAALATLRCAVPARARAVRGLVVTVARSAGVIPH